MRSYSALNQTMVGANIKSKKKNVKEKWRQPTSVVDVHGSFFVLGLVFLVK